MHTYDLTNHAAQLQRIQEEEVQGQSTNGAAIARLAAERRTLSTLAHIFHVCGSGVGGPAQVTYKNEQGDVAWAPLKAGWSIANDGNLCLPKDGQPAEGQDVIPLTSVLGISTQKQPFPPLS